MPNEFANHFRGYTADHPAPADDPALDGHQFAEWLESRRALPAAGRIELAQRRVTQRRFPSILWLPERRTLVVILRFRKSLWTLPLQIGSRLKKRVADAQLQTQAALRSPLPPEDG